MHFDIRLAINFLNSSFRIFASLRIDYYADILKVSYAIFRTLKCNNTSINYLQKLNIQTRKAGCFNIQTSFSKSICCVIVSGIEDVI